MGVKERKEREKELRREEIIKTGEKLFIKKGFEHSTMDEIARECELAKGTLYLYFKSKEELLSEIIYRALSQLYDLMNNYQSEYSDPVQRLRRIGDAHFEFYEKSTEHFRLLNDIQVPGKFHPGNTDDMHSKIHERIRSIWKLNMDIISDGIKMGVFRESTDPLEVAVSLWNISTSMIRMHDFRKYTHAQDNHLDMPFSDFDFLKAITINAKRIIFSILRNPPADFDQMLKQ